MQEEFTVYRNNSGLTLIEIIIAMAIIGIIALAIIEMFSSASVFIVRAGDTTESLFQSHKQIETILTQKSSSVSPTNMELKFSSDGSTFTSEGNIITVNHIINKSEVEITFFHPKY